MFENAVSVNSYAKKIAYKSLVSASLIALAVLLPQLLHLAVGQAGGVKWLPMYLPVLIGGCLLGVRWGALVGVLSPAVSFIITSLISNPMPAAARLPFMMAELLVFAAVSGLFTKKIAENGCWAFAAVISAQLAGRAVFLALSALFGGLVSLEPALVLSQIRQGLPGLALQAVLAPVIMIALRALLLKDGEND